MNADTKKIKSWVGESILLCVFFLPFGIAALFYAAKVIPLKAGNRIEESKFYAHKAKRYVKIGFFTLVSVLALSLFTLLISYTWVNAFVPNAY